MTRLALNAILIATLLFISFAADAAVPDAQRVAAALESLRQSINAHDFSRLEPALDADFSYQGRDVGMSKMIMRQVIATYPHEITAITILSISEASNAWEVAVRLEGPDQTEQRNISLSLDYRFVQADIADIQLAGHGQQAQKVSPRSAVADLPAMTTIPFELAERIIVVQAKINGVAGNYLVDSGAQVVTLNEPRFAPDLLSTFELDHEPPRGVGGAIQEVQAARDLELDWGAIRLNGLGGLVTDLSHLEKNLGIPIMGVIGYNVLEQFLVYFDYAAQELTLFSLDDNHQPVQEPDLGNPELVMSFETMGHIPVLPVRIGGLNLRLGIDSGAAGAMLFERWQDALRDQYEFIKRDTLTGADANVQMGDVVRIDDMQLKDLSYPDMTFRFNDIAAHDGRPLPLDGLLGYEFLKTKPTAINFRARQLLIWPRGSRG
ncbi:MAG: pepsin/retropepsin-like aspartic protease family protein [Candidatus Tectomicrobia bacterium]